jgi:hypothetical protein
MGRGKAEGKDMTLEDIKSKTRDPLLTPEQVRGISVNMKEF